MGMIWILSSNSNFLCFFSYTGDLNFRIKTNAGPVFVDQGQRPRFPHAASPAYVPKRVLPMYDYIGSGSCKLPIQKTFLKVRGIWDTWRVIGEISDVNDDRMYDSSSLAQRQNWRAKTLWYYKCMFYSERKSWQFCLHLAQTCEKCFRYAWSK